MPETIRKISTKPYDTAPKFSRCVEIENIFVDWHIRLYKTLILELNLEIIVGFR